MYTTWLMFAAIIERKLDDV